MSDNCDKKEFGDYQTPVRFALDVCKFLHNELHLEPEIILEPTAGIGNFIYASLQNFNKIKKIHAVEIKREYVEDCKSNIKDDRIEILNENFFSYKYRGDTSKEILIIGNPPWATNANLKRNLPNKTNLKRLSGIEAITGASNFDICEYIILKVLNDFKNTNATIAMLCKTSVARNIVEYVFQKKFNVSLLKILNFNAKKIFNVSASACLLVIKLSKETLEKLSCNISSFYSPAHVLEEITYTNKVLKNSNIENSELMGDSQLEWRQGVKHDCASIMELSMLGKGRYLNKKGDILELEDNFVFPLIKSSAIKTPLICDKFEKFVIVTQKKPRSDTSCIKNIAPLTWDYLRKNRAFFSKRKSTIYKGAPDFSMFGVGIYSYSKYKVGISGFYKKPLFSLIYNKSNTDIPVMMDDTAYFLSFDEYDVAYVCMLLLNSDKVSNLLHSISFEDAKRPYTKKVLKNIDLLKCAQKISFSMLKDVEKKLGLKEKCLKSNYENFFDFIKKKSLISQSELNLDCKR